jgi:hypothetical protein
LEELVENTVKIWEMEVSHKKDLSQWTTIDHDKYELQVNGGPMIAGKDAINLGNYNVLLSGCPAFKKSEYFVMFVKRFFINRAAQVVCSLFRVACYHHQFEKWYNNAAATKQPIIDPKSQNSAV